jgi:uncharacterized flavoprotein (TIGR03862 family)
MSAADVVVVGAGPAGLRAAEVLAQSGLSVAVFDAMPSAGRKFLLAGRGGLNLTHSESFAPFLARYGHSSSHLQEALTAMDGPAVRRWAEGLGVTTFVGSSGRVFPTDMKAAPLLRAWLQRLRSMGVRFYMRHRWLGFAPECLGKSDSLALRFVHEAQTLTVPARACVLALGGASWKRLGSDGAWWPVLHEVGVGLAPLQPSNCGFDVEHIDNQGGVCPGWTPFFRAHHAGAALKNVAVRVMNGSQEVFAQRGEFVVTQTGVEGSLIYAASAFIREQINQGGHALMTLDLLPQMDSAHVMAELARPRGSRSLSTHLKSRLGLMEVKAALLYEVLTKAELAQAATLAAFIKALPIKVTAPRPLDEAISTAGGVRFDALDEHSMLKALPGVFCAGEMLDWEAPTGGYLLTACLATGQQAARGVLQHLNGLRQ